MLGAPRLPASDVSESPPWTDGPAGLRAGSEPLVGAVGAGAVVALGEAGLSEAGPADADGAAALGAGSEPLVGAVGAGAVVVLGEAGLSEAGPADADGPAGLRAGSEPPVAAGCWRSGCAGRSLPE